MWQINVEYRGSARWAVLHHSRCLSKDGEWDYEIQPSSRTDEWLNEHRMDLPAALWLAHYALPTVTVNGLTAEDYRQRWLTAQDAR